MRAPGILDLVGLAATLAFALPLAAFGAVRLAEGRPLGLAFLALAALMIAVQRYLTNPFDPLDAADAAIGYLRRK